MKKLIILQGPPASGKSTWTKHYLRNNSAVVVSRDIIRHSMGEYNMDHEDEVTRLEEEQTITAMQGSIETIINDGTNLNPKYLPKWEKLAAEYRYEVEYKQFYVPFKDAVERDKNADREHHVGEKVIKRFYRMYYKDKLDEESKKTVEHFRMEQDKTLPKAVICDLDGTIAWMQNRSPYSTAEVDKDKLDSQLATLLNILMSAGVYVLFTSGRMGTPECREKTMNWLEANLDPVAYDHQKLDGIDRRFSLIMRKNKDFRSDDIVKKELFEEFIKPNYNVICAFDDRNKVVNMWREIGLLCCQVADGDF